MPFFIAAAVGLTAYSVDQQAKAGRAQQRAYEAEKRKAEVENVRKAREAVRQARIVQSQMQSQAALTGGMGSSGLAGGLASVGSQLAGNLNYMSEIATENTAIADARMQAAQASTNAAIAGQIGSFMGQAQAGDYGSKLKTIFSS
jgi:hypothetical protein